jgi:hypothetical protein
MSQHKVTLNIPQNIMRISVEVRHADVQFDINQDEGRFGTLTISKGGIDWRPKWHHDRACRLGWKDFDLMMRKRFGKRKPPKTKTGDVT